MSLRILFIGDVVGSPGRRMIRRALPRLIEDRDVGLVVCNAENAAGGSGLTIDCYEELVEAGVDVVTLGDHAYRKDEVFSLFERNERICRPANYPVDSPGPGMVLTQARDDSVVAVFPLIGRTFMHPVDCPFRAADGMLERIGGATNLIIVDLHAEATSEKQLLGRYLDGRVSAALGTHTHVPTADETILLGGTAYQTDVGMTGPYDSVIGRRYDRVLSSTLSLVRQHLDVASGDPRLCGCLVEIDTESGKALEIQRLCVTEDELVGLRPSPH